MNKKDADALIQKIIAEAEANGIDHHEILVSRQGNSQYVEVKISIKIK